MKTIHRIGLMLLISLLNNHTSAFADEILEKGPELSPTGLSIKVRAEGPATRETALQIACFFEYQPDDVMTGGTELFDKKMNGAIKQIRQSNNFEGHALETLLLKPPKDTVPAKILLLIGLGDKKSFSLERMQSVGTVAVREAMKLSVEAFSMSPNVTDAGVTKFAVGQFDEALVKGVLTGYKTQKELSRKNLTDTVTLKEFTLEAGKQNLPAAFDAVQKAIKQID